MNIQEVFYTIASLFFVFAILVVSVAAFLLFSIYTKLNKILDSVGSTVVTSSKFLQKTQIGIASGLLGLIRMLR